jgi:hypothetical protein
MIVIENIVKEPLINEDHEEYRIILNLQGTDGNPGAVVLQY